MATRAVVIAESDMHALMLELGFRKMMVPGTNELIYGKIVQTDPYKLSLRVFTTIYNGQSLETGKKAIEIQLYYMLNDRPICVGKMQRCLRTKGWRDNIKAAVSNAMSAENYQMCPRCGAPMVWREPDTSKNQKFNPFWGCATYPVTKCSGRPDNKPKNAPAPAPAPAPANAPTVQNNGSPPPFTPPAPPAIDPQRYRRASSNVESFRIPSNLISPMQKRCETVFNTTAKAILIVSRAGGGKTALLKHLASFRAEGRKMVYTAFNRKNAKEGKKKLPREVTSTTTHSFMNKIMRDNLTVDQDSNEQKNFYIMEGIYPALNNKDRRRIRKATFKLIGLAKAFACKPGDLDAIKAVQQQYTFELLDEKEYQLVVELTSEALQVSLPQGEFKTMYCFDDMLWWPIVMDLPMPKIDDLLCDEVQDFNMCQLLFCERMQATGSRLIAVGDPYQAVYRFRGADSRAFDKLRGIMQNCVHGFEEVLLPTNYRCGKEVIDFVREATVVHDIEAAPTACHAVVRDDMTYDQILDMLVQEFGQRREAAVR